MILIFIPTLAQKFISNLIFSLFKITIKNKNYSQIQDVRTMDHKYWIPSCRWLPTIALYLDKRYTAGEKSNQKLAGILGLIHAVLTTPAASIVLCPFTLNLTREGAWVNSYHPLAGVYGLEWWPMKASDGGRATATVSPGNSHCVAQEYRGGALAVQLGRQGLPRPNSCNGQHMQELRLGARWAGGLES